MAVSDYLGLLLADGRLPVGAHTQSAGIEPAFQGGLRLEQLPDLLAVRLRTVTEVEAATAVVARHTWWGHTRAARGDMRAEPVEAQQLNDPSTGSGHVRTNDPSTSSGHVGGGMRAEPVEAQQLNDPSTGSGHVRPNDPSTRSGHVRRDDPSGIDRLIEVDRAWRARTASDAVRAAADLLGRGYLRLGSRLWDLRALGGRLWCRAVVVGVLAAEAGLDGAQTARLVGFEDVQTAVGAALKLQPFDPAQGAAWSMAAAVRVEAMVDRVAGLTEPRQIPAYAAPQLEHWAQAHQHSERRLFRA